MESHTGSRLVYDSRWVVSLNYRYDLVEKANWRNRQLEHRTHLKVLRLILLCVLYLFHSISCASLSHFLSFLPFLTPGGDCCNVSHFREGIRTDGVRQWGSTPLPLLSLSFPCCLHYAIDQSLSFSSLCPPSIWGHERNWEANGLLVVLCACEYQKNSCWSLFVQFRLSKNKTTTIQCLLI